MIVALEHGPGGPAKLSQVGGADAVKLVDAQADLAGKARFLEVGQNAAQLPAIAIPDAVGHDLVEAKSKLGRPATDGDQKFGIEKRLAAREAENADAVTGTRLRENAGPRQCRDDRSIRWARSNADRRDCTDTCRQRTGSWAERCECVAAPSCRFRGR